MRFDEGARLIDRFFRRFGCELDMLLVDIEDETRRLTGYAIQVVSVRTG